MLSSLGPSSSVLMATSVTGNTVLSVFAGTSGVVTTNSVVFSVSALIVCSENNSSTI